MFWFRNACSCLILTTALIGLTGCGGGEYRAQETYYLVAANIDVPYWQAAKAGLVQAAREIGVAAEMVGSDEWDPQAEKQAFEDLLTLKAPPAGIMVSPANPEAMRESINKAIRQGINVITVDSDDPKSDRLFFVGTDNYSAGVQSAEVTAEQLESAGNVIVFTISGQANLEDRLRGYRDVMATFPAVRVIDVVDIKGDATVAFDLTKEILAERRRSVDAFVCLEALACPEVAEVLSRNSVRNKIVVAMDTSQRTLEWVQNGMIQATIAQRPYTMAYMGLRLLADMHKYPPTKLTHEGTLATIPDFIDTGTRMVNKDNVDQFMKDQQVTQPADTPGAE